MSGHRSRLRWSVSLLAATTLVMGFVQGTGSATPGSGRTNQAGQSVSAPTDTDGASRPDKVSAMLAARLENRSIRIADLETDSTIVSANPDGTVTVESAPGIIQGQQGDSWVPVDTTLLHNADGSYSPKATASDVSISGGGGLSLATLSDAGRSLGMSWLSKLPAPTVDADTATYKNIAPSTDLVVTATADGLEQSLILNTQPAKAIGTVRIPLSKTGLTFSQDATTQVVTAVDTTGKPVFTIPAPQMWDASVDAVSKQPANTGNVDMKLVTGTSGKPELDLTPDAAFIT